MMKTIPSRIYHEVTSNYLRAGPTRLSSVKLRRKFTLATNNSFIQKSAFGGENQSDDTGAIITWGKDFTAVNFISYFRRPRLTSDALVSGRGRGNARKMQRQEHGCSGSRQRANPPQRGSEPPTPQAIPFCAIRCLRPATSWRSWRPDDSE